MGYFPTAIKGIGWMGVLQGIFRLLTLLKFVIIARLLDPSQIGLFGLVMLMVSFFESISDFGLSLFLVQATQKEDRLINAVWTVSIIRGLILTLILLLVSYPIATFFNVGDNIMLFLIGSIIPFVKSFANPSIAKFQKHLHFHKEFLFRSTIVLIEVISSIVLVFILKSPIALVYSLIFSSITETILSLLIVRPIPKFTFEIEKIREIVDFGKWVSLIGTTSFFANQLDSILVGRLTGAEGLGIYQIAQKFSLKIMSEAGDVVAKVVFPIFAKIKSDHNRLKAAFLKTFILVSIIFGLITVGLMLYSSEFILVTLGEQWLVADKPLKIFAILGFATVIMSMITSLFLALGRADITAKSIIFRSIILSVLLFIQKDKLTMTSISFLSLMSFLLMFPFVSYRLIQILKTRKG